MKLQPRTNKSGIASLRLLLGCLLLLTLPLLLFAAGPQWWSERGVLRVDPATTSPVPANDYAAVNQGQVKNIAKAAVAELDAHLPGGAGDALHALVSGWSNPGAQANDYAAINLGQLKNIAKPFYDRLIAVNYTGQYPWAGSTAVANDYAAANIGQVKNLFSFDLMSTDATHDTDRNGLPDWWERHYFGHLGVDPNALAARGDGLTNSQAYQQGLNPNDYYNGQTPTLTIVSGNNQTGAPGGLVSAPLTVSVADSMGNPLINAPVNFTVASGGGTVQKTNLTTPVSALTLNADSSGLVKAYFKLPNSANSTSSITATAESGTQNTQVIFSASSDDGTGTYADPFDPSDISATLNSDGSVDVTWTNHTDPADTEPINLRYRNRNGSWVTAITVPAGTTSTHIPPQ